MQREQDGNCPCVYRLSGKRMQKYPAGTHPFSPMELEENPSGAVILPLDLASGERYNGNTKAYIYANNVDI